VRIPVFGNVPFDAFNIVGRVRDFDRGLYVVWNHDIGRYEVWDRLAPGGESMVMRVQEPSGAFRPLDGRVLDTLSRCRRDRFEEVFREAELADDKREAEKEKGFDALGDMAEDILKFAGKPFVGWTPGEKGEGHEPTPA
jgi:hypothetical protein